MNLRIISVIAFVGLSACKPTSTGIPVVGFVDAFQDNTIAQAREGFEAALAKNGFSEKAKTMKIVYRNAQGNIPTLTQIVQYFQSQEVTLIATCPSLSTITAVQNTTKIPIFMMVSPTPSLMHVTDAKGNAPADLFGVAEDLAYIDTSFLLIPRIIHSPAGRLTVGMLFNQSEPQSVEAIHRIQELAAQYGVTLLSLPVNASADVPLVTAALLRKHIDAFFANPDNTVFASFESIEQSCRQARVPIFTSEAGLVSRGALAAYGADIYQWGYQAGEQAAPFLRTKNTNGIHWEMVRVRKKVFNPSVAEFYHLTIPSNFEPIAR
jgi:putative ABC transport system substrate-binding protein